MMPAPVFIRTDVAIAIHRRQIAEHGGADGIRDASLLESALSRPKNLYHYAEPEPTLAAMAASYAFGIARNHPFVDGNKRVSLVLCRLFLRLNGVGLTAAGPEKYMVFMRLAAGEITEAELSEWIAARIVPVKE